MADEFEQYRVSTSAPDDFEQYRAKPSTSQDELDPNVLKRVPGALGNVASDVWGVAKAIPGYVVKTIKDIPEDIEYLKKNVPAAGSLIKNDPALAGREAIAGLADLGHTTLNLPHGLAEYLVKIGMIKPETAEKIPYQRDISSDLSQFVGEEKPGGGLLRGAFRNAPAILTGGEAASILNPLKFTSKNIAKDVLKKEEKQVSSHSNRYNKIWEEAENSGFNKVPVDTYKLTKNLEPIEKYKTPKEYESLKEFINKPTLQNAQKAQSDMGIIHRKLQEKSRSGALNSEEKAIYTAAKDAEKHIEENMFKNSKGEINKSLQKKYGKLTQSYRENVVPYKYNADIQAFKNREILAKELIQKLKRGEFAAKKGSAHPRIGLRDLFSTYGLPGSFGAGYLLKALLGETPEKNE